MLCEQIVIGNQSLEFHIILPGLAKKRKKSYNYPLYKNRKVVAMVLSSIIGFPRIGENRELKKAVEDFWKGAITEAELFKAANDIKIANYKEQMEAGIDLIPCNDFSFYDQMLDTAFMLGVIPERFVDESKSPIQVYFDMARGTDEAYACEMTKWFDTNYHYIVPEIEGDFTLKENIPLMEFKFAKKELNLITKPVIIGPFTFLKLSKTTRFKENIIKLIPIYIQIIESLERAGAEYIQIDEPALVLDLTPEEIKLAVTALNAICKRKGAAKIILQTYFEDIRQVYKDLTTLPIDYLGIDLVRGKATLGSIKKHKLPKKIGLALGVVDGRNIWATDLKAALKTIKDASKLVDIENCIIQSSCSLQHLPYSLKHETRMNAEIKSWLAFAKERLHEIALICKMLKHGEKKYKKQLDNNARMLKNKAKSKQLLKNAVRKRIKGLKPNMFKRSDYQKRTIKQKHALKLNLLPTTTIGSFPQTPEVRKMRAAYKNGLATEKEYHEFINNKIEEVIKLQEEIGIDVLVHGEFERSDMVDFFGQQLEGMLITQNGWVQSYGSRCVRPPIIYGDILRPAPMTVRETVFAKSLTNKIVKGMLTGPVTILNWSFVRDDIPREQVAYQLALALRDETAELEQNGIKIIQIDEPAFREGLPLKKASQKKYLEWAVKAFKLSSCGVKDETQIHTHMCYAEFNNIIDYIHKMDADVISIENSRSGGALLGAFEKYKYNLGIGPGVYDIHSPRVVSKEEILSTLQKSLQVINKDLIWVNPDCGLKTRGYKETIPSLKNMVAATREMRETLT